MKVFTNFDAGFSSEEDVLTKAEEASKKAEGIINEDKQEEIEWEYYSENEEEEKKDSDEKDITDDNNGSEEE